jgi:hypothetical protein
MTTKVYWAPTVFKDSTGQRFDNVDVAFMEPAPFIKDILKSRVNTTYFQCYGFLDYCKNIYIIKAPCDFTLKIDRDKKFMNVSDITQETYMSYFNNRGDEGGKDDPYAFTTLPSYTFYSDTDVMVEALPMFLHKTPHLDNVRLVPGTYNIGKWIRPLDFSAEMLDTSIPFVVKRGDPLFCVRFVAPDNSKVELERVLYDERLSQAARACATTKHMLPKQPFNKLYEMAEPLLTMLGFNKKSKCPFKWSKK